MAYMLGVDIGGTFTDVTKVDLETGRPTFFKTDSDIGNNAASVASTVAWVIAQGDASPAECKSFTLGTTVGVNAIITRTGAPLGLLTTQGFGDILEIGRIAMPDPFDLRVQRAADPILPRPRVAEVQERILGDGTVEQPLDTKSLERGFTALRKRGAEDIAISFLNAYRNPVHELEARAWLLERFPELRVWLSHEIWPEIREYERTVVTVVNGYLAPTVTEYLGDLEKRLRDLGLHAPLTVTTSNGGRLPARLASTRPGAMLMSGPAAGVLAASRIAQVCGEQEVLAFDMGGTSSDISVIENLAIPYAASVDVAGLPIIHPTVDVTSIGAGGGSVARMDNLGVLKVGPQSVGADPGPACYGRGGTTATITDAYVVLGWIDPANFLGGRKTLQSDAAHAAVAELTEGTNYSVPEMAEGILRVATANLSAGIGRVESSKGIDTRRYSLLAYGGAGPTHACMLAEAIGVRRVLVPLSPGTLCAWGAAGADFRLDYVRTFRTLLHDLALEEVRTWFDAQERTALNLLQADAIEASEFVTIRTAELRYEGQGYNLEMEVPAPALEAGDASKLATAFHQRYTEVYGAVDVDSEVEFMNARFTLRAGMSAPPLLEMPDSDAMPDRHSTTRSIFLRGEWTPAAVLPRATLIPGETHAGPCIVTQDDTTVVVPDYWHFTVEPHGTLILSREEAS